MRGVTTPHRMTPLTTTNALRGARVIFAQKELLKAAGWVITSGDGLSAYDGTTDVITHNGSGAGGMDNNRAWYRAQMPSAVNGIRKEFCHQVVTAGTSGSTAMRTKFSPSAGFVGGTPSATQVPSATDELVMTGNVGTDASPTGASGFIPTNDSVAMGIADAAVPYGFAFWHFDTSGVDNDFINGCRWVLDPVFAPHHTLAQDPDKYVVHMTAGGSGNDPWYRDGLSQASFSSAYGSAGWGRRSDGTWDEFALLGSMSTAASGVDFHDQSASDMISPDPASGKVLAVPGMYANLISGVKGMSTMIHWVGGPMTTSANNHVFDSEGETNAYIKRQVFILPWGGAAPGDFVSGGDLVILDIASALSGGDPPTIGAFSPPAGEVPGGSRAAALATPSTFSIADPDGDLDKVLIWVKYANRDETILVYDGTSFLAPFLGGSVATPTLDGMDFEVLHTNGWLGDLTLTVQAFDDGGNVVTASVAYTFPTGLGFLLGSGQANEVDHLFGKDIWFDSFSNRPGDYQVTPAGDWLLATGHEALRQAMLRRIITNPGEWATLPTYGVGARMFVKGRNTPAARAELVARIEAQLMQDPRIEKIEQVVVALVEGGLRISVQVQPKGRNLRAAPITATVEVT